MAEVEPKRKRGRPPKNVIEPIPDSAENVARAVVATVKRASARDRRAKRQTSNGQARETGRAKRQTSRITGSEAQPVYFAL